MDSYLQKYKAIEKIFDGPRASSLQKKVLEIEKNNQELETDDFLFMEAISYFETEFIKKVDEIIMSNSQMYLTEDEIYDDEMIEDIIRVSKNYKIDIKKIINIVYTDYQVAALKFLEENKDKNNLVIMPTGYGKTIISFNEIITKIKLGKKVVFSAPTNDLVEQQYDDFLEYLEFIIEEKSLLDEVSLGINSDKKICFVTNHKLEEGVKSGIFDENFFYVIDEVHEGEGKESEKKQHKYPSFKAFEYLKGKKYKLLAMSATPANIPVLKEKLGIEKIFNGSNRKFYIPKNRKFEFSDTDSFFRELENLINNQLKNELIYIGDFIENRIGDELLNQKEKELLDKYSKENLQNKTYIDSKEIRQFEEIYDRKTHKTFFAHLWKVKKVLEIRKKLYQNDYSTLLDYVSKEIGIDLDFHINFLISKKEKLKQLEKQSKNEEIGKEIDILDKTIKNIRKQIHINRSKLEKNKWLSDLLLHLNLKLRKNKGIGHIHPKVRDLFKILEEKIDNKKTIFVHVENEEIIKELIKLASKKGLKASYFKGGKKNKTQKFVDKYTKENIKNGNLDVVFVTSVFKLGMNYDIEDLIFYHPPKNKKDLLQFEGRVGRYSSIANVNYMGVKGGFEEAKVRKTINNANLYLEKQFDYADNWLENYKNETAESTKNSYEKKGILDKTSTEYSISDLIDKNLKKLDFVYSRFKIHDILGIYKDKFGKFYISLYVVDNSCNRGVNVHIHYSGRLRKEEKIIQVLNELANTLIVGKVYSISGKIIALQGGEDIIISLKYDNPSQKLNGVNKFNPKDYIFTHRITNTEEKQEIKHKFHKHYNSGRNYMTKSLI